MMPDSPSSNLDPNLTEPSVMLRFPRVQRYTLAAVLGTLVTVLGTLATVIAAIFAAGNWYGSLNAKLDTLSKSSDANSSDLKKVQDDLTNIQSKLSATQQAVEDLGKYGRDEGKGGGANGPSSVQVTIPAVELKIPEIPKIQLEPSASQAPQESALLSELIAYEMAGEVLKSQASRPGGEDAQQIAIQNQYLSDQRDLLKSKLEDLDKLLDASKMPDATKERLKKFVKDQLQAVECIRIDSKPLPSGCPT